MDKVLAFPDSGGGLNPFVSIIVSGGINLACPSIL